MQHILCPEIGPPRAQDGQRLTVRAAGRYGATMTAISPPPTFADSFPARGPWKPVSEPPPRGAFTTELLFPDGKTAPGVWTGRCWWGGGHELAPLGWRWVPDYGLSARA